MSKWIAEFELEDGDKMPEHMDLEYHGVKLDFYCRPLEQEPCEDAVSRAEVIKIAKEMYLEVANMELDVKTISDCISCTSSKCREVLERKLQALSSVTPQEPRWIPVTEKLPEKDAFYLVTEKSSRVCTYVFHKGNSEEYWKRCAVAWMPLPKSYKEESERQRMIYTGRKVYDPLTNTYSTGYWIKDERGYWYPVWRK